MKVFLKKHYLKISILCLIITAAALLLPQISSAQVAQQFDSSSFNGGIGGAVLAIFANLFLAVINMLGAYVLLPMINLMVQLFSYNNFLNSHAVEVGWPLVRDVCNMFFVVILLLIAFSTILHYHAYEYKEALPRLILMAIVINFSKTIMGLLIDFGQVVMLTFVNAFQGAAASNLVNSFGLTEMLKVKINTADIQNSKINGWEVFASLLLAIVLLIVAIGVMLAYVAVLVYRILVLWVLVILSPIAFFLAAFEAGEHYAEEFWEKFWSQLTTGIIMAFFMWLALSILSASYTGKSITNELNLNSDGNTNGSSAASSEQLNAIGVSAGAASNGGTVISEWDRLYTFVIAIALLLMALEFAEKAGGFAGKFAGSVAGKLEGMAVGHSGPLKRFRTAYEAYSKLKEQRHHEKYSAWGYKAAEVHGNIQTKIGQAVRAPFQAAGERLKEITGFDKYEKEKKDLRRKQDQLKKVDDYRDKAKKIDKALQDGEIEEKQIENSKNLRDEYLAKAAEIEQEEGFVRTLTAEDLQAEQQKKEQERLQKEEEAKTKTEEANALEADLAEHESEYTPAQLTEATAKLEQLRKEATAAEEAEKKIGEDIKEIETKIIPDATQAAFHRKSAKELKEQVLKAKASGNVVEASRLEKMFKGEEVEAEAFEKRSKLVIRKTKADLDNELKEHAKSYLENKSANVFGFTKAHWVNKAEAARDLASAYSNEGKKEEAKKYTAASKKYDAYSRWVGKGTTGLAIAAGAIPGLAPVTLAVLSAKTAKWLSNTDVAQGNKLNHMGRDFQFAEVRKEMKELESLDQVSLEKLTRDTTIPKIQRIAAILEYLRQEQDDSSNIENDRLLLNQLGADHKTKEYLEQMIQQQYPDFGHLKEHGPSLTRQIELNLTNPKGNWDSSQFKAKRGQATWELLAAQKYAMVMDTSKRSKAVEDNMIEGAEMAMEDLRKTGYFDDASNYGELSKKITRYFAIGKKDAKFEKVFMNDKGEIQHLGLLKFMAKNKDIQNVVAFTRFDKILEKMPKGADREFLGKIILGTDSGQIMPALVDAVKNGDAPSQASAQKLINYIADLAEHEDKLKATIEAAGKGYDDDAAEKAKAEAKKNFDQLWEVIRKQSVSRSGPMSIGFDWSHVPPPDEGGSKSKAKATKEEEED